MQTIGKIINGKYVRYGAVSVGDKLGDAAFANIVNNATTTEEGFVPDARVVAQQQQIITQQQEQIDSLNSAINTVNNRLLKNVERVYTNISNNSESVYYLTLEGPSDINILFVTLSNFSNLKNGVVSVGGINQKVWVILAPKTTLSSLTLRIWYV